MNLNFDPFNLFSDYCTKRRYSEELGIISSIESTSRCWTRFNYRCFAGSDQCCVCFKRESYFLTHHYMYTYHYVYIFILFRFVLNSFPLACLWAVFDIKFYRLVCKFDWSCVKLTILSRFKLFKWSWSHTQDIKPGEQWGLRVNR